METRTETQEALLSVRDLMEYVGCGRTAAYQLMTALPSFKVGGMRRVRKPDLDAYIEERLAAEKRP